MIDLTPIIQAIIALLAAIVTYKVIPWIKARTTNEQQSMLRAAITTAVFAAEQLYGAGAGAEKMDFAIEYLRKKGFDVDRVEIEAAVGEYINNFPALIATAGDEELADVVASEENGE